MPDMGQDNAGGNAGSTRYSFLKDDIWNTRDMGVAICYAQIKSSLFAADLM